jgi:hypothetical protein
MCVLCTSQQQALLWEVLVAGGVGRAHELLTYLSESLFTPITIFHVTAVTTFIAIGLGRVLAVASSLDGRVLGKQPAVSMLRVEGGGWYIIM